MRRARLDDENRELQERLREQHAEKERKPLLPIEEARANALSFEDVPTPAFLGRGIVEPDLGDADPLRRLAVLLPRVELKGKYPAILEQPGSPGAVRRRPALLERNR